MNLDIGSGNNPRVGYLALDIDPRCADVVAEMMHLPFAEGSVERIYAAHCLEHISKFEVVPTLREWWRVLRVGGELELLVPDLVWCVQRWLQTQGDGWDMAVIFGSQTQDGGATIHRGEFHKTGFTEALVHGYLVEAGFQVKAFERIWTHGQETMKFTGEKGLTS